MVSHPALVVTRHRSFGHGQGARFVSGASVAAGLDPDGVIFAAEAAYPPGDDIDDKEYGPKGHKSSEHRCASMRPVPHEQRREQRWDTGASRADPDANP